MSNHTKIQYISRYTHITYSAYRNNETDQIEYLGTEFDCIKDWLRTIYRQEEVILCSFILNNISDKNIIKQLENDLTKKSQSLDIDSEIKSTTCQHLEKYIDSPVQLIPTELKEAELSDDKMMAEILGYQEFE